MIQKKNTLRTLTPEEDAWVEQTLASLTLREKIGQTIQELATEEMCRDEKTAREFFERHPYGNLYTGGGLVDGSCSPLLREKIELCQQASKVPMLIAGDLEHGAGSELKDMTLFPFALSLGAAADERLAYDYGRYTALEGRAAGFNWTFSPVVDLLSNWQNPIVSNRSLGDNPQAVSHLARAISLGLQDHGMAACAKHFPGDGVDFRDQHLVTSINSLSEEKWWEQHGAVFQSLINAGVYTIMAAHIALPWFEPMERGQRRPRPATASKRLLTDLLRGIMGFEGIIVSDALIMGGYTGWAPEEERLIQSFNAGIDVLLWPGKSYFDIIERAIQTGRVTEERLNQSVRRILQIKARLGLAKPQSTEKTPCTPEVSAQAKAVSREIAEKGITLVRNRESLLPFDTAKVKKILVHKAIPAEADAVNYAHLDYFTGLLKARGLEVTVLENGNCLDVKKREQAGESWDAYIVIYSAQNHHMKNTVRPMGKMAEVIWTQQTPNTVMPVTVSLNTPFLLHDMPFLDTLVNAYDTSNEIMEALDKALFGEIPFPTNSPVKIEEDTWLVGARN